MSPQSYGRSGSASFLVLPKHVLLLAFIRRYCTDFQRCKPAYIWLHVPWCSSMEGVQKMCRQLNDLIPRQHSVLYVEVVNTCDSYHCLQRVYSHLRKIYWTVCHLYKSYISMSGYLWSLLSRRILGGASHMIFLQNSVQKGNVSNISSSCQHSHRVASGRNNSNWAAR